MACELFMASRNYLRRLRSTPFHNPIDSNPPLTSFQLAQNKAIGLKNRAYVLCVSQLLQGLPPES